MEFDVPTSTSASFAVVGVVVGGDDETTRCVGRCVRSADGRTGGRRAEDDDDVGYDVGYDVGDDVVVVDGGREDADGRFVVNRTHARDAPATTSKNKPAIRRRLGDNHGANAFGSKRPTPPLPVSNRASSKASMSSSVTSSGRFLWFIVRSLFFGCTVRCVYGVLLKPFPSLITTLC